MNKTPVKFEANSDSSRKQYIVDTVILVIITILICALIVIAVGAC